MKYGIDLGYSLNFSSKYSAKYDEDKVLKLLSEQIIKRLKEEEKVVVDCTPDKAWSKGDFLYRKVINVNRNNIDLLLSLNLKFTKDNYVEIFFNSAQCEIYIDKLEKEFNSLDINIINKGKTKQWYLLKNCNVLCIIINMHLNEECLKKEEKNVENISDSIVKAII